jgi:hypothetical protein
MMRFHAPSFVAGALVAAAFMKTRGRLRPVAVELAALGVHLGRLGRSLAERRLDDLEDVWAEVEERVRERARAAVQPGAPADRTARTNGAARAA